jgi:hypothetical protein
VTSRIRWQGCAFCMLADYVMSHSRQQYSGCLDLWPSFILHIFWFSGLILILYFSSFLKECYRETSLCWYKVLWKYFPIILHILETLRKLFWTDCNIYAWEICVVTPGFEIFMTSFIMYTVGYWNVTIRP